MNKEINEIYEYYRAKFIESTHGIDKADYDGILIGVYLALATVVKFSTEVMHKDAGFYYDLEKEVFNAIYKAYDDEELSE